MVIPGRKYSAGSQYRYGYNGKELDKDISSDAYDYGMRISDQRLGRFLSVDPITSKYPELTPYQYASNNPIRLIDIDGLEGGIDPYYLRSIPKIQKMYAENISKLSDNYQKFKAIMNYSYAMDFVSTFLVSGRTLSTRNLLRYMEGQGGYDIYSYDELKNSSRFGYFWSANREASKGVMSQFVDYANSVKSKPGVYDVEFRKYHAKGQAAAMLFDMGTAFGSFAIVANGKFTLTVGENGEYSYKGNIYFTFADTYRWEKNRGGWEEEFVKHNRMLGLETVGAKQFYVRAYYEESIHGNQNSGLGGSNRGKIQDSYDIKNHSEPTADDTYAKPTGAKLINDSRPQLAPGGGGIIIW